MKFTGLKSAPGDQSGLETWYWFATGVMKFPSIFATSFQLSYAAASSIAQGDHTCAVG